ncbi:MAG TPA: ROK family protein [Bryobacteraceae bacterium]|nr:ROK family protein [Bryobacteraceae bacterium]
MHSFGGIEAGGTKFVCAIGQGPDNLRTIRIPTTTPQETIGRAVEFFRESNVALQSVGIASFGPVDLIGGSPTFGFITSTPKPGWRDVDLAGQVERALGVPVAFDTDVNGAVLAETQWGAARGLTDALYLTVGTGVGGGAIVGGRLVHGMLHPEMGHIRIPHDHAADPYRGSCPYHGDCLEGLACGLAMEERWGARAESLESGHPAWDLEAHYLALGLATWVCTLSPQRIVVGGGVGSRPDLLVLVRQKLAELLNGYVRTPQVLSAMHEYVVAPGLGEHSGVLGAIALAMQPRVP